MPKTKDVQMVPLTDAALRLKVGYNVAHRMLLVGKLEGERRNGRLVVSEASVRRVLGEEKRRHEATDAEHQEANRPR